MITRSQPLFLASVLASSFLVGCGAAGESQALDTEIDPQILAAAQQRYVTLETLAALGNDSLSITILDATPLDLSQSEEVAEMVAAEWEAPERVMPYILGNSTVEPQQWLQAHLVDRTKVGFAPEDRRSLDAVLDGIAESAWEAGWALDVQLVSEGETIKHTAFVFVAPVSPLTFELLDPVVLGADDVLEADGFRHGTVGASESGTWSGCEAVHEETMSQADLRHEDRGSCPLGATYNCFDRVQCRDPAKALIMCDISSPGCPRMVASTPQSGGCHTDSGGTSNCTFSDGCPTGENLGHVNASVKSDTVLQGDNCSVHTNIEMLTIGEPIQWEVEYSTPETPVGTASVKFSGTIPAHSIYQVFQQTMCCQAPPPPPPPQSVCHGYCELIAECDVADLESCIVECDAVLAESEAVSELCHQATEALIECGTSLACEDLEDLSKPDAESACAEQQFFHLEACG